MLEEILNLLRDIQNSQTGSIGSIRSHYIPQLSVGRVDKLAAQLAAYLTPGKYRMLEDEVLFELGVYICDNCGNVQESDGECLLCGKVTSRR